jgi:uncharacterized lipoprotein YddW (UPF0748 family)
LKSRQTTLAKILLVFLVALLTCSKQQPAANLKFEPIIGVKIYNHAGSLPALFEEWQSLGVNTAFVSASLDSNSEFRNLADQFKIKTFIILPIFFNPEALRENPDLYALTADGQKAIEDWVNFICPTRSDYRRQCIEYVQNLIRQLNPDGISLDFIRYFVFWEEIYPDRTLNSLPNTCFDASCLEKFQADKKITIPKNLVTTTDKAVWILKNCVQPWTDWKCQTITSMVSDIAAAARKIKPDILINIHLVPWRQHDFDGAVKAIAGQDFQELSKYVDFLSPMCYHHMLKRDPAWISSVVANAYYQTKGKIIPSIQVNQAYLTEELTADVFLQALIESLKYPSAGVMLWSWEQLDKQPLKKGVFKDVVQSRD